MNSSKICQKMMLHTTAECIDCGKCISQCLFLKNNGSPVQIAQEGLSSDEKHDEAALKAYDCSLCYLCSEVCPVDANPAEMFTALRSHAQEKDLHTLDKYSPLLSYEKTGRKFPFRDTIIPNNCETAFFPGCTLPALFPEATKAAFAALRAEDKSFGLILNCCSKPSKMLGLVRQHQDSISELVHEISDKGIKRILTGCPNCYITLKDSNPPFEVLSVYEELLSKKITTITPYLREVTIHDPCVTRFEDNVHDCIRKLLSKAGIKTVEMKHNKRKTLCCGEGGAVNFNKPEYPTEWAAKRISEASETALPMATYCAGCVNFLSTGHPTAHVLDLLLVERKQLPRQPAFPFNYANRLILRLTARMG